MKKRKYFENSVKYLKKLIKNNKNLTEEEWNRFARESQMFSSFTLQAKHNVDSFNELKEKVVRWF